MKGNILASYLKLLKVKHTKYFTDKFFNEHPHKNNLLGLSMMLDEYGVKNASFQIDSKTLAELEPPYIAHLWNDNVIVKSCSDNNIVFFEGTQLKSMTIDEFIKVWTGHVLLAEKTDKSIEPDYKTNKVKETFSKILVIVLAFIILTSILYAFIYYQEYTNFRNLLLFSISLFGTYIDYLLLLKQLNIHNNQGDKICASFKQNGCKSIQNTKEAKLFGILSWSEIGFGYFMSNILLLLFSPKSIDAIVFLNLFTLPFGIWSIWYQKNRLKQWCALCLLSVLSLWLIFLSNVIFGSFTLSSIVARNILPVMGVYAFVVIITHFTANLISDHFELENTTYAYKNLKANKKVFTAMLIQQESYVIDWSVSNIYFGNKKSKTTITIVTNPFCEHCAKLHKQLDQLVQSDTCRVHYVFSSFGKEFDPYAKCLIGIYNRFDAIRAWKIYNEWYENGKDNKEAFLLNYGSQMDEPEMGRTFENHKNWVIQNGIDHTPFVLVNGYRLPEGYQMEDLKYAME